MPSLDANGIRIEYDSFGGASSPGAELMIIEGMGHDLPPEVWPRVQAAIVALKKRAGGCARFPVK